MNYILNVILIFGVINLELLIARDVPNTCPEIIKKKNWGARKAIEVEYNIIPVKYVIVHHTVTPPCLTDSDCEGMMRSIQEFHMENLEFPDIGYNFVIGGNGKIYEGAGWHKTGAHTRGYNTKSIGIAFIGDFSEVLPNEKQLQAAKDFLQCAVDLRELTEDYVLLGGRQVSSTKSPGLKLYNEIKKWPHFSTVTTR